MRITKQVNSDGSWSVEIDTEASPYGVLPIGDDGSNVMAEPRLPTHQEYSIIRDLLGISETPDEELTDLQMNGARVENVPYIKAKDGKLTFTSGPFSPAAVQEMFGNSEVTMTNEKEGYTIYRCGWTGCPGVNAPHLPDLHGLIGNGTNS